MQKTAGNGTPSRGGRREGCEEDAGSCCASWPTAAPIDYICTPITITWRNDYPRTRFTSKSEVSCNSKSWYLTLMSFYPSPRHYVHLGNCTRKRPDGSSRNQGKRCPEITRRRYQRTCFETQREMGAEPPTG